MISKLTLNEQGRWQTKDGKYFTCGDRMTIRYYDDEEDKIGTLKGRVEHGGYGYYFIDDIGLITTPLNEQIEVVMD